jgi:alpha-L-fucosidase
MRSSIALSLGPILMTLLSTAAFAVAPPKPDGAVPTPRQLAWQQRQVVGFVHFTVNTFTDKEWGYGDEDPAVFNPTDFSADQIVGVFKDAGIQELVLTCKHHDGFCLWPSKFTEHSVKNSKWKGGKGDVVREISDACHRAGVKFGVYLSPWDRNSKVYGTPEYITYYRDQLRELLTEYGPICELWFDGANGGDGYYGGARETRKIDATTYYDWANTWKIVRELQPDACMFGGPDIRWVGNESGVAGDPCWATINSERNFPGHANPHQLNRGDRDGDTWQPAECDVSIRPGWFYHASQDGRVKSAADLLKIYYESVGRGANLMLNIPPDRRGRINDNDIKSLREWHAILDATFATNLAHGATVTASNTRGKDPQFAPENVTVGKPDRYWSTDDKITTPELVIDFGKETTFNVVRIGEYLPLGQRIDSFALDSWQNGKWEQFSEGTSIGSQRLVRTKPITSSKVRLRITSAPVCPAISEVGIFAEPVSP